MDSFFSMAGKSADTTPKKGCTSDSQCDEGTRCVSNACVDICSPSPCSSGYCVKNGAHSYTCAGCTQDSHCSASQKCVNNSCTDACSASDCATRGQACSTTGSNHTYICYGCTSNSGCSGGKTCNTSTKQCVCPDGQEDNGNGGCSAADVCPSGYSFDTTSCSAGNELKTASSTNGKTCGKCSPCAGSGSGLPPGSCGCSSPKVPDGTGGCRDPEGCSYNYQNTDEKLVDASTVCDDGWEKIIKNSSWGNPICYYCSKIPDPCENVTCAGSNQYCSEGACLSYACTTQEDCAVGQECKSGGTPNAYCTSCGQGSACNAYCKHEASCGAKECTSQEDCAVGQECLNGSCKACGSGSLTASFCKQASTPTTNTGSGQGSGSGSNSGSSSTPSSCCSPAIGYTCVGCTKTKCLYEGCQSCANDTLKCISCKSGYTYQAGSNCVKN